MVLGPLGFDRCPLTIHNARGLHHAPGQLLGREMFQYGHGATGAGSLDQLLARLVERGLLRGERLLGRGGRLLAAR